MLSNLRNRIRNRRNGDQRCGCGVEVHHVGIMHWEQESAHALQSWQFIEQWFRQKKGTICDGSACSAVHPV